ncbi:hypothetical protein PR048_030370 [Dryococelus australis]|uniref:Uncharacterized protein n=1 Tax=Dryococelus australis TaxID=614101 RepID=A0ABQ9GCP7_9NEOP|nr:hypothetical protein PR048_030370 [Dryococelus australis]
MIRHANESPWFGSAYKGPLAGTADSRGNSAARRDQSINRARRTQSLRFQSFCVSGPIIAQPAGSSLRGLFQGPASRLQFVPSPSLNFVAVFICAPVGSTTIYVPFSMTVRRHIGPSLWFSFLSAADIQERDAIAGHRLHSEIITSFALEVPDVYPVHTQRNEIRRSCFLRMTIYKWRYKHEKVKLLRTFSPQYFDYKTRMTLINSGFKTSYTHRQVSYKNQTSLPP